MKSKTRLAVWLGSKNKDYQEGLSIYKDLAVNQDRNMFLTTMVPTPVHVNMLTNDLKRYARIHQINPMNPKVAKQLQERADAAFEKIIQKAKPEKEVQLPGKNEDIVEGGRARILKGLDIPYEKLPAELQTLYDEFKGLYERFDTKRAEMNDLPETAEFNKKRKELAGEVVGLRNTIRLNWEEIDKWVAEQNSGKKPEENQPDKASGVLSKAEIENIEDEGIKALSKKMRIEANLKYIARNAGIAKKEAKVQERMTELDEWGVSYAEIVKKDSSGGISI